MEYRSRRGNQLTLGQGWRPEEIMFVSNLAGKVKAKLIARELNRSYESVRQMAKRMNISLRTK